MNLSTQICQDPDLWDRYVEAMPAATNYHRWRWGKAIRETYGHRIYPVAAFRNEQVEGVLPLVFMQSRLFGRSLVSMPFFSYGGVLANSPEVRNELAAHAIRLGSELDVRHVELRQNGGELIARPNPEVCAGWQVVTSKLKVDVALPQTADELWMSLSAKLRKRVRYARNHGLSTEWGGAELLNTFYRIFAVNMRNLGTPVYPVSWFRNLIRNSPQDIHILVVRDGAVPVASAFVVGYRDGLELPWAASLPDARDKFSTLLMYWTLLEWGVERGYKTFDLGRCTPQSGNHQFKRYWSSLETPLSWHYWVAPGHTAPSLNRDAAKYQWPIRVWKKLPLPIANFVGPRLVSSIP